MSNLHGTLDMDGCCKACGEDCSGAGGSSVWSEDLLMPTIFVGKPM